MSSAAILFQKGQKEAEKLKYELRKSQVTTIKGKLTSATDNHVSSINQNIDRIETKIESAIKGIQAVQNLTGKFADKKEKYGTNDSDLSQFDNELAGEIDDCNTKIQELENDISSLQSQYITALNDEREAAKKALENAAKAAANLI